MQKIKGTVAACSEILNKAGLTGWRMGQSRVFLRYYHKETLQLMLKDMDDKAILIQKTIRGFLARKWLVLHTSSCVNFIFLYLIHCVFLKLGYICPV